MSTEAADSSVAVAEAPSGIETELVGSPKSSRRKKNKNKNTLGLEAAKTPVVTAEPTQVADAVEDEQTKALLVAELDELKERFNSREGTKLELDDADGQDIHQFDAKLRNGHLGKMGNGKRTYDVIAKHGGFPVGYKQLERLHARWLLILEFRSMGVVEPRLGVTKYDAVKKLTSVQDKLDLLRKAEAEKTSASKLRSIVKDMVGEPTNIDWHKAMRRIVSGATNWLTLFSAEMAKAGHTLNTDDRHGLDDLAVIIERILGTTVTES